MILKNGEIEILNYTRYMSIDKYKGCLVGLAVGDALGTTLEFQPRDAAPKVTEMIGGGIPLV